MVKAKIIITMSRKLITIILLALSLAVMLWLALLNFGAPRLNDLVLQIAEWKRFCIRASVLMPVLVAVLWLAESKNFPSFVSAVVIAVCAVEAIYATLQLYGFEWSNHGLYKETGSFYNPGPLGGFIAIGLVVALGAYLELKYDKHNIDYELNIRNTTIGLRKPLSFMCLAVVVLVLLVLPSTMSRTAWMSAVAGSAYVALCHADWRRYLPKVRWQRVVLAVAGLVLSVAVMFGVWHIKSGSATGRMLMWKVSAMAVADSPITGHDNFKSAYGEAQERYFRQAEAQYSQIDDNPFVDSAASPDYAFNEYLNFAVEWGLPLTLAVLAFMALTLIVGHRNRQYGLVGGLLALLVFSFASYPMHVPAFVAVMLLMVAGCWWNAASEHFWKKIVATVVLVGVGALCLSNIANYSEKQKSMQKWSKAQYFYNVKSYDVVEREYSALYGKMSWNGRFMYEYGHALHNLKMYEKSNTILLEADKLLNDPMTLNVIGKNYQMLGQYDLAEQYFEKSSYRVPNRMYPYYLTMKMYSDSVSYDSIKAQNAAKVILNMHVKVESEATRQMIDEAENYLNNRKKQ